MNKTFGFIFARGGSKGLHKKNILEIGGIPLLAHGIKIAQNLNDVETIFVSTDCEEIASIAKEYGAEVINRPKELATDIASEWQAWKHAINIVIEKYGQFDRFLSLPPTAPLRSKEDVERCLNALQSKIDLVVAITTAHRNPWFNMVIADNSMRLKLIGNNLTLNRRQDAPSCYDLTTVAYVSRPKFILESNSMWEGSVKGIEVPIERSIDIDTEFDFKIAKLLMESSKIKK